MNTRTTPDPTTPFAFDVITDLALAINQCLGVEDVQHLVVEKAVAALRGSSGSVMMPADEPGAMVVVATIGRNGAIQREVPAESPVAEWVVRHDEPMLLMGRSGPLAHMLHREDITDAQGYSRKVAYRSQQPHVAFTEWLAIA